MDGKPPEKPSYESEPGRPTQPVTPSSAEEPSTLPPVPVISPLLARRLGARVLDPDTAVLAPGQPAPLPTVYVGDSLLVRDVRHPDLDGEDHPSRVAELVDFAARLPDPFVVEPVGEPVPLPTPRGAVDTLGPNGQVTVTRVRISRDPSRAGKSPDAWRFLQTALMETSARGSLLYDKLGLGRLPEPPEDEVPTEAEERRRERRDRRGRSMAGGVSVEHVLTAGGGVWGGGGGVWGGGGGVWGGGGGVWGGGGLFAEYGTPGIGGRSPVVWSAPDPRNAAAPPVDAPVVAILDTGLGKHPWFPDEPTGTSADTCNPTTCTGAHRRVTHGGQPIGVRTDPSRDPENTGVAFGDVNGLLDVLCGHGTFIAGVVRQRCPEAVILSVPVMASDGAALEDDVVAALSLLLDRHRAARKAPGSITHGVLDVVNLSLGYYHETPEDADDTVLSDLLRAFADEGVVVVACAGNDATRARFFPAAFSVPGQGGLVGVGATNPDDRSIALFSNDGDWVTAHAPGAGIISSVPTTLSGSQRGAVHVDGVGPGPRSSVDFDDFRSGFAVWSGTSFASPWIAGDIAREIVASSGGATAAPVADRALTAATAAVERAHRRRFGPEDA